MSLLIHASKNKRRPHENPLCSLLAQKYLGTSNQEQRSTRSKCGIRKLTFQALRQHHPAKFLMLNH